MSEPVQGQPQQDTRPIRAFTIKALVFGCVAALALVAFGGVNNVFRESQTPLVGNYLAPTIFALLILLVAVWNPLLGRWQALRFRAGEMAVVVGLCFMVAWIPHGGFGRFFLRAIAFAPTQFDSHPEWRPYDTFGHLPPQAVPLEGSVLAGPLRASIASERAALASGALGEELAKAGTDAARYAVALDLAELVPAREIFGDAKLARSAAEVNAIRAMAADPERWRAADGLLKAMPTLVLAESTPAEWKLAHARLKAEVQKLRPAAEKHWEQVYPGFLNGLPSGDEVIGFDRMPVQTWLPTLLFWLPLVLLGAVASVMLALLVHKQWAHHEQLRYPIANLASTMMATSPGSRVADVFRSRLFWWGMVPVAGIHLLNFLAVQFPGALPSVPLHWNNQGVIDKILPLNKQSGGVGGIAPGDIYFCVIGLTYFIAAEISLSVGLAGVVMALVATQWYLMTGMTSDITSARTGAWFAYAAIIAYTGRQYYAAAFLAAVGRRSDGIAPEQAWAARLLLLSGAGFVAVLHGAFGIDWPVALFFSMTAVVLMLVTSRLVCETGLPLLQAGWMPAHVISTMIGPAAIGPGPIVSMYLVSAAFFKETRESLMPFANTALKVAEDNGAPRLRFALIACVVIAIAVGVGIAANFWGFYNFGASRDGFAKWPGIDGMDAATRGLANLVETGRYAESAAATGLDKIGLVSVDAKQGVQLGWMAFGAVGLLVFAFCRFRFAWFPLHPVIFVVMGTWMSARIWTSILIGWAIKAAIVRFGGGKAYQDLKPLFIGLIVGELGMAVVTIVHPWVVFWFTGVQPQGMGIFPA